MVNIKIKSISICLIIMILSILTGCTNKISDTHVSTNKSTIVKEQVIRTININQSINQNDCTVKIDKIDITKDGINIYYFITNNTNSLLGFVTNDSTLLQGYNQFDTQENKDDDNKNSTIMIDFTTDGTLTYKGVDINKPIKLILTVESNDEVSLHSFIFDISLN